MRLTALAFAVPAWRANSFTCSPSPGDCEQDCGVSGLPLAAPSLPRPGSLTPPPLQPKSIWPEPWAGQTLLEKDSGRSRDPEPRGSGGGPVSGAVGRRVCRVRRKGGPRLPRAPAPRGLPCISRGEPRGSLTFRLLLCQRFVPGKGGPRSWWYLLAPLQWGPGRSVSKAGCVCPQLRGSSAGGAGGVLGPPPPPHGLQGLPQGAEAGLPAPVSQNPAPVPSAGLRWTRRRTQVQGEGGTTSHQGSRWKG